MSLFKKNEASEADKNKEVSLKNKPARSLYRKLGFHEADVIPCDFNGIPGISLVLLEKAL